VMKYLREHPEKRHNPRGVLVLAALSEAWPCEEQ
jgi:Rap1a immunity proteins